MKRGLRTRLRSRRAVVSMLVLLLLFILVVSGGGHLGLFARVEMAAVDEESGVLTGVHHEGSYRKMFERLDQDLPGIRETAGNGPSAAAIAGPLPRLPRHLDSAVVGVLGSPPAPDPLPAPLIVQPLPRRRVVVARIRAHRTVAAFKTYRKARGYIAEHGLDPVGGALEIYHDDGTVELQVPVLAPVTTRPAEEEEP